MTEAIELAKEILHRHRRDADGNCFGCNDEDVYIGHRIPFPCDAVKLSRLVINVTTPVFRVANKEE